MVIAARRPIIEKSELKKTALLAVVILVPTLVVGLAVYRISAARPRGVWTLPAAPLVEVRLGMSRSALMNAVPRAQPAYLIDDDRELRDSNTPPWSDYYFGFSGAWLSNVQASVAIPASDADLIKQLIARISESLGSQPLVASGQPGMQREYLWRNNSEIVLLTVQPFRNEQSESLSLILRQCWATDPYQSAYIAQFQFAPLTQNDRN